MNSTSLPPAGQSALVVDDDEFSRDILRKTLLHMGIRSVALANNGREGVVALDGAASPPDFLICDIFMPDMDGIEFIAELIRRQYKGGLILVTGVDLDMLDVARKIANQNGLNGLNVLGCFFKPLQEDQLKQVLRLPLAS